MIKLNNELKLHINKLRRRAIIYLFVALLNFHSLVFGILFLFVQSFVSIILFTILVLSILYLIYSRHVANKEEKELIYKPVIFDMEKIFSFDDVISIFEKMTDKKNQISTSEDVRFFRFNKIFKLRVVLYRTQDFDKKEFDNKKARINKKANKKLNISQWVDRSEVRKMMRFNIIYTDVLNEKLYQFISQNANRNLARGEGIINIVIVGKQIVIPPIYGECNLPEVSRYKNTVKFINQVLLNS